ncbi:DUF2255 family protein [Agromyces aureus]|uniref:DUF2255 domain-containing protein n=1 Tax=Agromyces aureus TaxID=453304 RepID=A0A191WI10_9MICO|nr:DUF2255 family protein [Agromyces aureus]ANJ27945.1 hypothetical protein ATC03_15715 [Agromyces aureus]
MSTWTPEDLTALDRAGEIRVAGRRDDGSLRTPVVIWHAVVDGSLYARSVRGPEGGWYRGVTRNSEGTVSWGGPAREVTYTRDESHEAELDAAYFAKYGRGSATQSLMKPEVKATTLRIDPK